MYEQLEEYLSGTFSIDYWYDEGYVFASDLLKKFSKNDWEKLLCNIHTKPRDWQIRFAYSTSDINNEYVLESLILLSNIDDDELFETCIDSLRVLLDEGNSIEIVMATEIKQRIEKIMGKCDHVSQKMFENFLKNYKDN